MAHRFPGGATGLLQALSWIQRSRASGVLSLTGDPAGRLFFREGALLRTEEAAGAAPGGDPRADSPRSRAQGLLDSWAAREAGAEFSDGASEGAAEAGTAGLNAADLIMDLVRRNLDPHWIQRRMSESTGPVANAVHPPDLLPGAALGPTEAFLMSRADGTLTFEEILRISPIEAADVALGIYALFVTGLLDLPGIRPPGQGAPEPGAGPPSKPAAPEPSPKAAPAPAASPAAGEAAPAAMNALDAFLARTEDPGTPEAAPKAAGQGDAAEAAVSSDRSPTGYARAPAVEKERQAVIEWISGATGADYYRVLGVERGAGEDSIRRSYYRLAKKFHPDRFRRPGFEELLQDVERMFALTTEAYNTLTDDRMRAEYERELAKSGPGGRKAEADTVAQARESYLRAKKHIEAEEYFDAATLLETATRLDASKAEYWILLGTVQEKNPRWRRKAEESYKQAIEIAPADADAFLHLARLYKAGGLTRRAHEMYRQALQWDPDNEEAQSALSGKEAESEEGVAGKIRSLFKGSRS